ncbi:MAG: hypothetical protein ACOYO1_05190 [Bacteroidales bacterium]
MNIVIEFEKKIHIPNLTTNHITIFKNKIVTSAINSNEIDVMIRLLFNDYDKTDKNIMSSYFANLEKKFCNDNMVITSSILIYESNVIYPLVEKVYTKEEIKQTFINNKLKLSNKISYDNLIALFNKRLTELYNSAIEATDKEKTWLANIYKFKNELDNCNKDNLDIYKFIKECVEKIDIRNDNLPFNILTKIDPEIRIKQMRRQYASQRR